MSNDILAEDEILAGFDALRQEIKELEKEVRREWLIGYEMCGQEMDPLKKLLAEARDALSFYCNQDGYCNSPICPCPEGTNLIARIDKALKKETK
jgi:hypothetical protein